MRRNAALQCDSCRDNRLRPAAERHGTCQCMPDLGDLRCEHCHRHFTSNRRMHLHTCGGDVAPPDAAVVDQVAPIRQDANEDKAEVVAVEAVKAAEEQKPDDKPELPDQRAAVPLEIALPVRVVDRPDGQQNKDEWLRENMPRMRGPHQLLRHRLWNNKPIVNPARLVQHADLDGYNRVRAPASPNLQWRQQDHDLKVALVAPAHLAYVEVHPAQRRLPDHMRDDIRVAGVLARPLILPHELARGVFPGILNLLPMRIFPIPSVGEEVQLLKPHYELEEDTEANDDTAKAEVCCICATNIRKYVALPCRHFHYCYACIKKTLYRLCTSCGKRVEDSVLRRLYDGRVYGPNEEKEKEVE